MLRGLLRDSEATKVLFEKVGLFKAPELLEKYVIASEVTVEVLDVFLSRVFGTERGSIGAVDLKPLLENLGCVSLKDRTGARGEDLSDEPDKEVEGLRVKVENLERQLCALQRQIQMQGNVLQLDLDGRLDEMGRECERRVSEVTSHVSSVADDVARLKMEVEERTGDVKSLSEAVSRLKKDERDLKARIPGVEKKATKQGWTRESQGEIKKVDEGVKVVRDQQQEVQGRVFVCDSSKPLEGIIAHLTRECQGNVHDKGAIEVTASCPDQYPVEARNVVEFGTNRCFCSEGRPNSWIRYDFKKRRVSPTSYSIRTEAWAYPTSWVLEVSNDGSERSWQVVDHRETNSGCGAEPVTRNFAISDPPSGSFRFVRLRQTGRNHSGTDALVLFSLELFGILSPS